MRCVRSRTVGLAPPFALELELEVGLPDFL